MSNPDESRAHAFPMSPEASRPAYPRRRYTVLHVLTERFTFA